MSSRNAIALLSGSAIVVALACAALLWFSGIAGSVIEPDERQTPPDSTPDATADLSTGNTATRAGRTPGNGPNVPDEDAGFRTSPDPMADQPPPSPPPPIINPNPGGEGEKDFERIPPTRPALDLRQELERVHKDVGATARVPLSLFR